MKRGETSGSERTDLHHFTQSNWTILDIASFFSQICPFWSTYLTNKLTRICVCCCVFALDSRDSNFCAQNSMETRKHMGLSNHVYSANKIITVRFSTFRNCILFISNSAKKGSDLIKWEKKCERRKFGVNRRDSKSRASECFHFAREAQWK